GAAGNTDLVPVTIRGTSAELAADLVPFRRLITGGIPLVMVASAVYPAYGPEPALWEPAVHRLLRTELGFEGATISDALEPVARTRGIPLDEVAVRAARSGIDLLLFAGGEAETARVYESLVRAARDGRLSRASLEASARRIGALAPG
ncbi:MAG: glycoside hydrolase family 3 N-terminal domain-containing protein, partial [Gaiella sp.]